MSKELQLIPGLPNTPGWVALNQNEREWIQEHTSNFVTNFRQSGQKMISACMELGKIDEFLKGKPMTITNWMSFVLPKTIGINERTGWSLLKGYRQLREASSDQGLSYLAEQGLAGFNNVGVNRLLPILESLPAPKSGDPKVLEPWKEKVVEGLRKGFSEARKKGVRKLKPEEAMKAWLILGNRLLRECKLENSAAERAWIAKAVGYFMEKRAIRGTISAEKVQIPDEWWPRRGAPRGPRTKKKAA